MPKGRLQTNIVIMRTFVRLRQLLNSHQELAQKFDVKEQKYGKQLKIAFNSVWLLMTPPEPKRKDR